MKTQTNHSEQTAKNNALMLKMDRERETRRLAQTEQRDTAQPSQQDLDQLDMAKEILALQAHAERLAEALRQAIKAYSELTDYQSAYERKDWKKALVAWEGAQK